MTIKLNISGRKSDRKTKHIPFETKYLNTKKNDSFIRANTKVVNPKKLLKTGVLTSSMIATMTPTLAHAEAQTNTGQITGQEILEYGLTVGKMGVGAAVGISIVMLTYTGVLMMFKQKQKSKEWTSDIIKGLVHCLVAIPVVFAIYYISTSLFGSLDFTNPSFLNTP